MNDNLTNVMPDHLQLAADAAREVVAAKSNIIAAFANGRRPVLIIDTPPPFVVGSIKRRSPNALGGVTEVYAASFHGCQLEWMRDLPGTASVQVVQHG